MSHILKRGQDPSVLEVAGLYPTGKRSFGAIAHDIVKVGMPCKMMFFTDNSAGRGKKLCAFIRRHKLGTVYQTKGLRNPNSGNTVRVWLYLPHPDEIKDWWKENGKDYIGANNYNYGYL